MITINKLKRIFLLSLPIIGGMVSQNLLNLVDTAMVGQLGATALAAVGIGSFAVFMSQAMVLGLSSGVQAVASRRVGEGRIELAGASLVSGMVVAILLGGVLCILIYPFVPVLFSYLNADAGIAELAVPYWQIRLLAIVFMGFNYAFRGYFNGISQPKYYMLSLIAIHIMNVILNYVFIYGHLGFDAMGTDGAALASAIATVFGTCIYIFVGLFKLHHLSIFKRKPSLLDIVSVFKLTIPAGMQQLMIAVGITSLFWMVGLLGVTELAALNILINILMLCILPGFGFGMAAATLVGTSLGEKDYPAAKQWAYDVAKVGGLITLMIGIVIAIFAEPILSVFTQDKETITMAVRGLQITGGMIFIDVMSVIMMNSLLGSGDVSIVLKTSVVSQWVVFFPIGCALVYFFEPSFLLIWFVFMLSRLGQGVVYTFYWHRESWGKAKI